MDRRRAAGALLALAACFARSAAAPTSNDHTALDLHDGGKEGCYYNFQHYGEGDRIMTNEPCLNCTCHNRMLMCYLRVCPFTKAIGQDCTVEKRADQCCPIVTCPDVPVDLLTLTSTSSPAEYGGTGVGKVDHYGCSIDGKYFPEGAKVPPTPGKPCEHCYCIRNMTTCVMQECTLHVDGCTPIYQKNVCCPVRYFCDHPDEMPLLEDMTTTERPTPGFLLTTTTEAPTTDTPVRRDCFESDQLYPDGALIKTEKPCVHCYCMKGDIVCVVQECGTPMENEGKNCTSLPPREGQCCPDTYICEGDELSTEITEAPYEELTTLLPPRRVLVEGSGYRNEPDDLPYTEIPTFSSEIEGSGEEPAKPIDTNKILTQDEQVTEEAVDERLATTEEEKLYSSSTSRAPVSETVTIEPEKGQTITLSGITEEESSEPSILDKTTAQDEIKATESTLISEQDTQSSGAVKESSEPSIFEKTTLKDEIKPTDSTLIKEQSTITSGISEEETSEPTILERTTQKDDVKATEPTSSGEPVTVPSKDFDKDEEKPTEQTIQSEQVTVSSDVTEKHFAKATEPTISVDKVTLTSEIVEDNEDKPTETNIVSGDFEITTEHSDIKQTPEPSLGEEVENTSEITEFEGQKTTKPAEIASKEVTITNEIAEKGEEKTTEQTITSEEPTFTSKITIRPEVKPTEETFVSEPVTVSSEIGEEESSETPISEEKIPSLDIKTTSVPIISELFTVPTESVESSSPAIISGITPEEDSKATKSPITSGHETISSGIYDENNLESTKSSIGEEVKATESTIAVEEITDSKIVAEEDSSEPSILDNTTLRNVVTEPAIISEQNTTSNKISEEESTKPSTVYETTQTVEVKGTEPTTISEQDFVSSSISEDEITDDKATESTISTDEKVSHESSTISVSKEDVSITTTEPTLRKENEGITSTETSTLKEVYKLTTLAPDFTEDIATTSGSVELSSSETIAPSIEHEQKPTTEQLTEDQEVVLTKEPTTESLLELSTFAHITNLETVTANTPTSEIEQTGSTAEKVESLATTTINPEDNEISEDDSPIPSPGRIPGEGDCLLDGTTYKNDSIVPSTNKCHSSCRCVSSIVKCDPMICSPPPEFMDNCQLTYDTPESCCPTYICDHLRETIPPQSHSQMSGTESPITPPSIDCHGDECEVHEEEKAPAGPSVHFDEKQTTNVCTDDKCMQPTQICADGKCQLPPTEDQSQTPHDVNVPIIGSCESPDCKEDSKPDIISSPCEGESCNSFKDKLEVSVNKTCEGQSCEIKPITPDDITPVKDLSQACKNEEDCKETNILETGLPHCEGDSCPSVKDQLCNNESGCEASVIKTCEGENCEIKPETSPSPKDEPPICTSEEDCKKIQIPETTLPHCEGESCTSVEEQLCNNESGCEALVNKTCKGEDCEIKPDIMNKDEPKICISEEDCKESKIPETVLPPCEGEACNVVKDQLCDKESGCDLSDTKTCEGENCETKPEGLPAKDVPQACENEENCKETKIPETAVPNCEGESCTHLKDDCSEGECSTQITLPPQISQEGEACTEKSGCKKPGDEVLVECAGENCHRKQAQDVEVKIPSECTDSECMQQKPISPSQETTATGQLSTGSPISEQTLSVSMATDEPQTEDDLNVKTPEAFVTKKQELQTELPELYTTLTEETATHRTEEIVTSKPDKQGELIASSITEKDEGEVTRTPEQEITTKVPELVEETHVFKSPEVEEKLPEITTQPSDITSELPEMHSTKPTSEDESVVQPEETVTESQEFVTKLPDTHDVDDFSILISTTLKQEENIYTESPQVTELPVKQTSSADETEKKGIFTEVPSLVTEEDGTITKLSSLGFEEVTSKPEDLTPEQKDKSTIVPEGFITENEISTKSPLEDAELETSPKLETTKPIVEGTDISTELPESAKTTLESELKDTAPSSTEKSEIPEVSEESVTKLQGIVTESTTEQEFITKPSIGYHEQAEEVPGRPIIETEVQTELPVDHVTRPQDDYSDNLDEKKTTQETAITAQVIELSTKLSTLPEEKEVITQAPSVQETEEKDVSTESTESHLTLSEEYDSKTTIEQEDLPRVTKPQNVAEIITEENIPHQDSSTDSPVSLATDAKDIVTKGPEFSASEAEKDRTEDILSIVTKSPQTEEAATQASVTVQDENLTEFPILSTKLPEDEEQIKTELPQSQSVAPTITEIPLAQNQHTTTSESETKIPEQDQEQQTESTILLTPVEPEKEFSTETPYSLVTVQETNKKTPVPERESASELPEKESLVTQQQEQSSDAPVTSVTESKVSVTLLQEVSTEPSVTSTKESMVTEHKTAEITDQPETESPYKHQETTKIPASFFTEKESEAEVTEKEAEVTEKVTAAQNQEPSITEQYEIGTEAPDRRKGGETATEQQGLDEKSPEEAYTEIPENITKTPDISVIDLQEQSTDKQTSEFESDKEVTGITEATAIKEADRTEIPVDLVTETHILSTPKTDYKKDSTEGLETTITDQASTTVTPESIVTNLPDAVTESSDSPVIVPQKGITKSPEMLSTAQEDITTRRIQFSDTEQQTPTTELPEVSLSEFVTKLPESHYSEPEESEIKTDKPLVSETEFPEIQDKQTELPTDVQTDKPRLPETTIMPSKTHDFEHEEILTEAPVSIVSEPEETGSGEPELTTESQGLDSKLPETTKSTILDLTEVTVSSGEILTTIPALAEEITKTSKEPVQEYSETTPYLVELEEHTHKIDEEIQTELPSEEPTTVLTDIHVSEHEPQISEVSTEKLPDEEKQTEATVIETKRPYDGAGEMSTPSGEPSRPIEYQTTSVAPPEITEKSTEPPALSEQITSESTKPVELDDLGNKYTTESQRDQDKELSTSTTKESLEDQEQITPLISTEIKQPSIPEEDVSVQPEKDIIPSTTKPLDAGVHYETTGLEEEFIPATTKVTTAKIDEEAATQPPALFDKFTKPEDRPSEMAPSTPAPEIPKPGINELPPTDEQEEDSHFPPTSGYGQEPDYVEEDQAFGPGTCRYGGKVYVSAQQIPRDDPCDFCFCFRSDIICLQQSCPPPIHGCHEEPIQGFCCPRYECPVSMATTLNVTTTTTTTTTTLPPHFLPHAYKGAAQRRGCQIKGHTYKVGEVVRASSGPCLHCTCGGDGQMKCDPKACTPEPMLRQMIAAAVSAKRRR